MSPVARVAVCWLVLVATASADPARRAPSHPGIAASLALVDAIRAGRYAHSVYPFASDEELDAHRRAETFRDLAAYVQRRSWSVELAELDYAHGGIEDSVDVWLRAADGAWVALYVGYHYDHKQWLVDGYEYPKLTFDKRGKSLAEYVAASKDKIRHLPAVHDHHTGSDGAFQLVP